MFAPSELAARIDRAEGRLVAAIARAGAARAPSDQSGVFDVAGGLAVYAGPGSPSNKMIGIGFDGLPDDADLARVERAFAERDAPLQAEVSTLAHPELHARLVARGYEPRGFEHVLGHPLTGVDVGAMPPHIAVERVRAVDVAAWMDVVIAAFQHLDAGGVGGDAVPPDDEIRKWFQLTTEVNGFEGYAARLDGGIAGGGSMRIDAGVAQLCGAGTLPVFRRRGVQTALLRWRLRRAREAGCEVATVVTQPGSKSQQNVQREGFHLLYARQLLVKPPK